MQKLNKMAIRGLVVAMAAGLHVGQSFAADCVSGVPYVEDADCTMPTGITLVTIWAWGGGGGTRYRDGDYYGYGGGGGGAFCGSTVTVNSGATLTLDVAAPDPPEGAGCDETTAESTTVTGFNNSGSLEARGGKGTYNADPADGGSSYYCQVTPTSGYSTIGNSGGSGGYAGNGGVGGYGGGGGGSSGSPTDSGNDGAVGTISAGGAGGAGSAYSGAGGNGGNPDGTGVQDGVAPGGGAGGYTTPDVTGAVSRCGARGQVILFFGYTIGGTVTGLGPTKSVVLQNNADEVQVDQDGNFTFPQFATAYDVQVKTQPDGQVCTVSSGTGTANANVTNVTVTCSDAPPPAPIPTLSEWAMGLLMVLLLALGIRNRGRLA